MERGEAGEADGTLTSETLARIMLYIIISLFPRCVIFFHLNFSGIRVHTVTFGRDLPAAR